MEKIAFSWFQAIFVVYLHYCNLDQDGFRTGFTFTLAFTKKNYLPIELFFCQIGPNWINGPYKTSVGPILGVRARNHNSNDRQKNKTELEVKVLNR